MHLSYSLIAAECAVELFSVGLQQLSYLGDFFSILMLNTSEGSTQGLFNREVHTPLLALCELWYNPFNTFRVFLSLDHILTNTQQLVLKHRSEEEWSMISQFLFFHLILDPAHYNHRDSNLFSSLGDSVSDVTLCPWWEYLQAVNWEYEQLTAFVSQHYWSCSFSLLHC